MKIIFTTKNIDRKLYEKLTLKYIYEHYYPTDYGRYIEQDKWTIEIKPTTDYDTSFYANDSRAEELDFSIPHGVTGKGNIICYVSDSTKRKNFCAKMATIRR